MNSEETITLDCPNCRDTITESLSWFKQTYTTCPNCEGGLAAEQFAPLIDALEQAFDASIEEMLSGQPEQGCGCSANGCGGGCGGH